MPTTIDSQPINVNQGVSTVSKSIYAEPVPSPNGTNYERLFIVRKPFAEAMAFDAAMPKYGSGDDDPNDIDLDTPNSGGDDLRDQIYQLLGGKLDDADIEMLLKLIEGPDDNTAPMSAQDRRLQAHDGRRRMVLATDTAEIRRRVAQSGVVRAERAQQQFSNLVKRFPNLKNARVV
jgi:hypothetical protein